jgi:putative ABC transport system ATP-binding protein
VPETTLAAENISVTYRSGSRTGNAVRDVSVRFAPGEVALLMGPSGSGKTSLLSVLGCLRIPDKGSVELMGSNLAGCRENVLAELRRRHVGYVFQGFRLFRALTALENVRVALDLGSKSANVNELAIEALTAVGMERKQGLKPGQMSGGEQQRVAIARALVKNPAVILADEPTAALDSTAGSQVADLLTTAARKRGCIALIATHDPRLLPVADRVVRLVDGEIVDDSRRTSC